MVSIKHTDINFIFISSTTAVKIGNEGFSDH